MTDQSIEKGYGVSRPLFCANGDWASRGGCGGSGEHSGGLSGGGGSRRKLVELDAKLTADGVVICFHDADLARTTNASGSVKENSWETIRELDAGGWFSSQFAGERVPLLSDALALLKSLGLGVNVEIKPNEGQAEETAKAAIAVIRESWNLETDGTMFVSSFWSDSIQTALDVAPEVPRAYLAHRFNKPVLDNAEALKCGGFNPNGNAVPESLVREAKERGFVISSYTINAVEKARELRSWGVDGIITDDPAMMIEAGL